MPTLTWELPPDVVRRIGENSSYFAPIMQSSEVHHMQLMPEGFRPGLEGLKFSDDYFDICERSDL